MMRIIDAVGNWLRRQYFGCPRVQEPLHVDDEIKHRVSAASHALRNAASIAMGAACDLQHHHAAIQILSEQLNAKKKDEEEPG